MFVKPMAWHIALLELVDVMDRREKYPREDTGWFKCIRIVKRAIARAYKGEIIKRN